MKPVSFLTFVFSSFSNTQNAIKIKIRFTRDLVMNRAGSENPQLKYSKNGTKVTL